MRYYLNVSETDERGWVYYDKQGDIVNEPTFSNYTGPQEHLRLISEKDYNLLIRLNMEGKHDEEAFQSEGLITSILQE